MAFLYPNGSIGAGWKLLTDGLPKVLVYGMVYEETTDVLVVATLGRGMWLLN